jgi:hypothetical protein
MNGYSITKNNHVYFDGNYFAGPFPSKFEAELAVWRMFRPSDCMVGKFRIVQRPNENMYTVTLNDEWVYDGNNMLIWLWLANTCYYIHNNLLGQAERSIKHKWLAFARDEIGELKDLANKYHKKTRKALPKRK